MMIEILLHNALIAGIVLAFVVGWVDLMPWKSPLLAIGGLIAMIYILICASDYLSL